MYDRQESEYFTAKRKAAKRLCRGLVKPADLPSNSEIRDQVQAFARTHEGSKRTENLRAMRLHALRMMRRTGCDGVIVGRGCLGRPWLFRELAAVLDGGPTPRPPNLREVCAILDEHARLLIEFFGPGMGMRQMRKWCAWYTKGFRGSSVVREALVRVGTLEELHAALARLDMDEEFPMNALRAIRGKAGAQKQVALPHGWLASRDDDAPPCAVDGEDESGFEDEVSGG